MSREAMQMALHTLEGWANYGKWVWPESALEQAKRNTTDSIAALRQALETEREWVGLTDDEAFKILDNVLGFNTSFGLETNFVRAFARAIEAKLKEKNT